MISPAKCRHRNTAITLPAYLLVSLAVLSRFLQRHQIFCFVDIFRSSIQTALRPSSFPERSHGLKLSSAFPLPSIEKGTELCMWHRPSSRQKQEVDRNQRSTSSPSVLVPVMCCKP